MAKLHWILDENTEYWAKKAPIPIKAPTHLLQYSGTDKHGDREKWRKHIQNCEFPGYCIRNREGTLLPSPENIMKCFKDGLVLEGLALTVLWSGPSMARNKDRFIYKGHKPGLKTIERALHKCIRILNEQRSVQAPWNVLVNDSEFRWGDVITSKVLHFMARSQGYVNPPVPIDKKVFIDDVWPKFKLGIKSEMGKSAGIRAEWKLPKPWKSAIRNDYWSAYNRYMTAIICWADIKGWTTTELENTIYKEYGG